MTYSSNELDTATPTVVEAKTCTKIDISEDDLIGLDLDEAIMEIISVFYMNAMTKLGNPKVLEIALDAVYLINGARYSIKAVATRNGIKSLDVTDITVSSIEAKCRKYFGVK